MVAKLWLFILIQQTCIENNIYPRFSEETEVMRNNSSFHGGSPYVQEIQPCRDMKKRKLIREDQSGLKYREVRGNYIAETIINVFIDT